MVNLSYQCREVFGVSRVILSGAILIGEGSTKEEALADAAKSIHYLLNDLGFTTAAKPKSALIEAAAFHELLAKQFAESAETAKPEHGDTLIALAEQHRRYAKACREADGEEGLCCENFPRCKHQQEKISAMTRTIAERSR